MMNVGSVEMAKVLGQLIRRAREREGLTQQALADKVGVTAAAVSTWESGTQPKGANKSALEDFLGPLSVSRAAKSRKVSKPSGMRKEKASKVPVATIDSEVSSFGGWLRDRRTRAAMSVPELAKKAKISSVAIYNIESGKSQNPQPATRDSLAKALGGVVPKEVVAETEQEQAIVGLGSLTDFEPNSQKDWPQCSGVYVLYDISQRPIYVGKATKNISSRLRSHLNTFWFRSPIVHFGSYIEVKDERLCHQLEQVMIKFLKSSAVINKQSIEVFAPEE